jgi:hypothetical protein
VDWSTRILLAGGSEEDSEGLVGGLGLGLEGLVNKALAFCTCTWSRVGGEVVVVGAVVVRVELIVGGALQPRPSTRPTTYGRQAPELIQVEIYKKVQ